MERTPRLYATMVAVLRHQQNWVDRRPLKTGAWMMVGWLQSGLISLTAWAPSVQRRAADAQSPVRRVARWLHHDRIEVHQLYGPLSQPALAEWGQNVLYLALETSSLWDPYGVVRLARIYRGRAIPLVWKVRQRQSRRIAYAADND